MQEAELPTETLISIIDDDEDFREAIVGRCGAAGSNGNRPGSCSASFSGTTGLASRCIFGSWDLQPVRTTRLPSLQDNMSCAGGTLLGFSQWEGEKEGRPFGGARRMNAATQTAGQLADDR